MRELTQIEIDNAPDWAVSYTVTRPDDLPMYESKEFYQVLGRERKAQPPNGASIHAKIIPRKEFDITKCEWSDSDIEHVEACGGFIQTVCSELYTRENKQDVINKAKHFKLTAEDLK